MKKDENEKKEELCSRRAFFKKAAKTALPLVAVVALATTPLVTKADDVAMGCNNGCTATCSGTCKGACSTSCKETCYTGCYNRCENTCKGTCQGSCKTGCYHSNT